MRHLSGPLTAIILSMVLAGQVAAASITVRITSLPAVNHGGYETAIVATRAGASCSITVTYYSGTSTASGLYRKTASSTGRVSWTWKVGTRTRAGSWPVRVVCRYGTATGSATRYLRVY